MSKISLNNKKTESWKADVAQSISFYNDWFLNFAPQTYMTERQKAAMVSSAVVVFRKGRPSCSPVLFTYGGSFASPSSQRTLDRRKLAGMNKWNSLFSAADGPEVADSETLKTLGDYFEVKRGIATGGNDFFVVDAETVSRYSIPDAYLTPT